MDGGGFYGGGGAIGGNASRPNVSQGASGAAGAVSPGGAGARRTQPLRPLTIKQLLEAKQVGEGAMVVDDHELGQVTVVGRVLEHDNQQGTASGAAKSHGYKISDATGVITVRHWIDTQAPEELQQPIGTFVRATGTVKTWQGKPVITGGVRGCTATFEAQYHLLECILTHQRLVLGHKPIPGGAPAASMPAAAMKEGHGVNLAVLPLPDAIMRVVAPGKHSNGVTLDEITRSLSQHFSNTEIRDALRVMMQEGRIFLTDANRYNC